MHAAENSPWKYLVLWLRLYFAIHYCPGKVEMSGHWLS